MRDGKEYTDLVRETEVHGSVYTDPDIFQDELARLWGRVWVYVGHESEIPRPGDYCTRSIGLEPVVMARSRDGRVRVFHNRCPHRGNVLCNADRGHAQSFRCAYHGWTFRNTGELIGIPYPEGYVDVKGAKDDMSLSAVPRCDAYGGFVFASLAHDGISLAEHLGGATERIDQLLRLSPVGELDLTAGWMKHLTKSNWKMSVEAVVDSYHPKFVHESLSKTFGADSVTSASVVRDLGNGHTELDWRPDYRATDRKFSWFGGVGEDRLAGYVAAMEEQYGPERAHEILVEGPPHTMIFPNLFLGEMNILVTQPLAVDEHVQYTTPVRLVGGRELNVRAMRQSVGAMGPAGFFIADDSEIAERNQRGLAAGRPEWLRLARGVHREVLEDGRARHSPDATDETAQRGFWREYARVMAASDAAVA